jgi:hypothetical protein
MALNTTYTLAEITAKLCPDCKEQESKRVSRKVQNQVNAGLIRPVKNQYNGRGVHRRYDQFELYKAKVLLEMHPFQAPNSVLKFISDLFDDSNPGRNSSLTRESSSRSKAKQKIRQYMSDAIDGRQDILLTINLGQSRGLQANICTAKEFDPAWRSSILINLTEVFRAVK